MMQKYEIEPVYWPDFNHESMIATLTGLEFDEIFKVSREKLGGWNGHTYRIMINKLGFNTNNRFIKFDKDTGYPCLMRCVSNKEHDPYWYAFPYYDGKFYHGPDVFKFEQHTKLLNGKYYLTNFFSFPIRVTSMLQVWI